MPLMLGLAACGTSPAPDFKGRWLPVNHFASTTQAIPLNRPYVFYASPMDGTLQHMLARWARDSDMALSYRHTTDFTLYTQVARIRTGDLAEALGLLEAAYAAQRLQIAVEGSQIVVRPTGGAGGMPAGGEASESP